MAGLGRTDASWPDSRRYGGNLSGKLAVAKGIGADHNRASYCNLTDVVFIELCTHPQPRQIAE
jgi:hypothetical protein